MRVCVIGAGIGGLALAQALRRAGIDVTVHDRDAHIGATQRFDTSDAALFIGRVPLRKLLAEGLGERVRFRATYTSHEVRDDGRSRVAAALAGRPTSAPCGYGCIAARIPLDTATRRRLPPILDGGPGLAIGARGLGVFLTAHDPAAGATVDPATCREVAAITEAPALVWGLIGPPPTGGGSAATAIRDAGHLATELIAARDGTSTVPLATLRFQTTMAGYAPGRVRDALGVLRSMQRLAHPVASAAAHVGLPALATWHRVRDGMTGLAAATAPGKVRVAS